VIFNHSVFEIIMSFCTQHDLWQKLNRSRSGWFFCNQESYQEQGSSFEIQEWSRSGKNQTPHTSEKYHYLKKKVMAITITLETEQPNTTLTAQPLLQFMSDLLSGWFHYCTLYSCEAREKIDFVLVKHFHSWSQHLKCQSKLIRQGKGSSILHWQSSKQSHYRSDHRFQNQFSNFE